MKHQRFSLSLASKPTKPDFVGYVELKENGKKNTAEMLEMSAIVVVSVCSIEIRHHKPCRIDSSAWAVAA